MAAPRKRTEIGNFACRSSRFVLTHWFFCRISSGRTIPPTAATTPAMNIAATTAILEGVMADLHSYDTVAPGWRAGVNRQLQRGQCSAVHGARRLDQILTDERDPIVGDGIDLLRTARRLASAACWREVKGPVRGIYTSPSSSWWFGSFLPFAFFNRFATCVHVPMCLNGPVPHNRILSFSSRIAPPVRQEPVALMFNRLAIPFKVILVSCRRRRASLSVCARTRCPRPSVRLISPRMAGGVNRMGARGRASAGRWD